MADDILTNIADTATEPRKEDGYERGDVTAYIEEIQLYDQATQKWRERSKKINQIYRDERDGSWELTRAGRKFNVLWANTQILQPMLYARNPKPDIQRRFKDADPVGRVTSDVLERTDTFFVDCDQFGSVIRQCVLDYCLSGRGIAWERYVPHIRKDTEQISDDVQEGEETEAPEIVEFEETLTDYVHRDDFGHNIARTWEEVWLGWRKVYLDRDELRARFRKKNEKDEHGLTDEQIEAIPLDYVQKDNFGRVVQNGTKKACIYEAWDKKAKKACWFSKSMADKKALDERDDPLGLVDFFPFPRPLLTNLDNDTLIPVPDYVEYQDQAEELNDITARVSQVQKAIKAIGVHNAAAQGLERMFNEGTENQTIPIDDWLPFAERGGIKGNMDMLDVEPYVTALTALYETRKQVKSDLDEITGMSDIVRSNTDPGETATAQKLKAMYSTQRLSDRQREVQRFVRDIIRIKTNIICNHFQIDTIKQISGVRLFTEAEKMIYGPIAAASPQMGHNGGPPMMGPTTPIGPQVQPTAPPVQAGPTAPGVLPMAQGPANAQILPAPPPLPKGISPDQLQQMLKDPSWEDVERLIKNQPMRSFRIDIETDSTIKADEIQQRQDAAEFITGIGALMEKAEAAPPEAAPFLVQLISWAARFYNVGKEIEGSLNTMLQKIEQKAANPPPQPPNPELIKVQGDLQLQSAKQQGELQIAQQKAQLDQQTEISKQNAQAQGDVARAQADQAIAQHKAQLDDARARDEMAQKFQLEMAKLNAEQQTQIQIAHIRAAAQIEAARVTASLSSGEEAEDREAAGE